MLAPHRMMPYAAGLAAVLALGSCSGEDSAPPSQALTPTVVATSVAPTPTPSSVAPTTSTQPSSEDPVVAKIPEAARPETREGAAAFARFYLEQLDLASRQGDPAPLEGLALDSCVMCRDFSQSVTRLKQEGRHHKGTTVEVVKAEPLQYTDSERTVLVDVNLHAVPIVDASGSSTGKTEADSGSFLATMKFQEHWFLERLQVVAR